VEEKSIMENGGFPEGVRCYRSMTPVFEAEAHLNTRLNIPERLVENVTDIIS